MAHITSIGAAIYTTLSISAAPADISNLPKSQAAADLQYSQGGIWYTDNTGTVLNTPAADGFLRITNVKEFPSMGIPANVTNVAEYGSALSMQIQSQADAPTLELTLNYIPADWANNAMYGGASAPRVNGDIHLFRFTLAAAPIASFKAGFHANASAIVGPATSWASTVENSSYYFLGKLEALESTPNLTDALTAKLTISVRSSIYGAFTKGN